MVQSNSICFNKDNIYFSLIFLFLFTLIVVIVFPNPIREKYNTNKYKKHIKKINEKYTNYRKNNNLGNKNNDNVKKIIERDNQVVNNSLYPPERRQPMHISNQILNSFERTRGNYTTRIDNYHLVGNCIRKSDEKIVNLYGRQKYPGSSIWEYYGETKDSSGMETKFKIPTIRNRELYNGDLINIPILDTSKGKFVVNIFDYELPRYNPYNY